MKTSKQNESFQIENNIVKNNEPKECKKIFKSYIFKEKLLKGHNKNALCWAFNGVHDGGNVERGSLQVMRCIIFYVNFVNNVNSSIENIKNLITYDKTYGIDSLKNHVDANHTVI
jgi:hypothetical protein